MKKNLITISTAIALIVFLIWWLLSSHRALTVIPTAFGTNAVLTLPSSSTQTVASVSTASILSATNTGEPSMTHEERLKKREAAIEHSSDEWRTPIDFYGMIVDESNSVVSGVQVDFSVNDLSATGTSDYHTMSDDNGFFSLKNVTGKLLVLNISKSGYYTSKKDNNSFEYGESHSVPDPNRPVVFHLRKKSVGEPLIILDYPGFAHIAQLKHDGTPVELDLLKGAQVPVGTGQLKLEFWRDLSNRSAKIFNWKLQVSILGGGFIGTDEEFPFNAPASGYQSPIVMDMSTNNIDWLGNVNTNYYFQLPDSKYGRMEFQFLPYNGVFTIKSAINPSGSKNLEPSN